MVGIKRWLPQVSIPDFKEPILLYLFLKNSQPACPCPPAGGGRQAPSKKPGSARAEISAII